jgi:Flp pilus assembly protein TadG
MRLRHQRRDGTSVVEAAVVYPTVFVFVVGLVVGAAGIFRYQEVASLARRAARYAAVHGSQYAKDTGNPAATQDEIRNQAVAPYAVGLDPNRLSCSVTYGNQGNLPYQYNTSVVNGTVVATTNTVSVTITYNWLPEAFLGGITLRSTSVMPMAY